MIISSRFIGRLAASLCVLWTIASGAVHAQTPYPSRAIRFIVPFSPGSASDILARAVGDKLAQSWGQPVIVENRPGAGGTIATGLVAKAEPDGYSLIVVSAGHVVNPAIYDNLAYDTLKDLAGVVPLANLPAVLVVPPSQGARSVKDLVNAAKARPGQFNFVSGGVGSASHVNAEKFRFSAGIAAVHVPLKGAPEMALELMAGRADFGFMPLIAALPLIKDGKLVALAVSSGKRAAVLLEVPTMAEAGEPGGQFDFWIGLLAPARTPRDIVSRLNREIGRILELPDVRERLARLGAEQMRMDPEQFDAYMAAELKTLGAVMREAGVKAQ